MKQEDRNWQWFTRWLSYLRNTVVASLWLLMFAAVAASCAPRNMSIAQPDIERCPTRLAGGQYAWVIVRDQNSIGMSVDVIAIGTWQEWMDTAAVHGSNLVVEDMRIGATRWTRALAIIMAAGDTSIVANTFIKQKYKPCRWTDGDDERFMWVDKHTAALWRGRLKKARESTEEVLRKEKLE